MGEGVEFKLLEKSLLKFIILVLLAASVMQASGNPVVTSIQVDSTLPTISSHSISQSSPGIYKLEGNSNRDGLISNNNLFFSFTTFNVGVGDTAQFNCTSCVSLNNVISRVTGGVASYINGNITSSIPNAAFWFINPSGILFGPRATVDVPAALHISNATKIVDANGTAYFSANALDSGSTLIISPKSFGFVGTGEFLGVTLDGNTMTAGSSNTSYASIDIEGSSITVQSTSIRPVTTTLIGADITVSSQNDINIQSLGSLTLSGSGSASSPTRVSAANQMTLDGDGVSTGIITDTQTNGNAIISTGGLLNMGATHSSHGGIYNTGSSPGSFQINAGSIAFNGSSTITDKSTGGGNLTVNVQTGGLSLGLGDVVSKSTAGTMNVNVSGELTTTSPLQPFLGSVIGSTASNSNASISADSINNGGTIYGDVTANNGNVTNLSTGVIIGSVTAGSGSGSPNVNIGNIYDYGNITLKAASGTQTISAANNLILDGSAQSLGFATIKDNQTSSADAVIRAGNILTLNHANVFDTGGKMLTLDVNSLSMVSSTINSAGPILIENASYQTGSYQVVNPIRLTMDGSTITANALDMGTPDTTTVSGSLVAAGQEFILTATNKSTVDINGEFGQHSNFIIDPSSNNSIFSGNPLYLQADNKNNLQANANNLFELSPFPFSFLQNGNLFINATGVQISIPNNSIISSEVIVMPRPLNLPDAPSNPCGTGSNLEIKNSNGVLPAYTELLPFSAFADHESRINAALLSEALKIELASNTVKKIDCGKA